MVSSPSLETIFFTALEKGSPAECAAYLEEACGEDRALRKKIERMLAAQSEVSSFLESPVVQIDPTLLHPTAEKPGTVIGRYKILEEIAEGGMGVVYMAEQREPVRRKVALKIVKPGMDTREVIARFEAERQALAMMDHPNIAKVFDAGETESGRPYFVMELVHGIPLTEYCDKNELTIQPAAGTVRPGLPGRTARPSKGDHPSRPQAFQRDGHAARRRGGAQGDRLRHRQGRPRPAAHRTDALHPLRPDDRHAALYEPGAGGLDGLWRSTPAATSIRWAWCSTNS